MCLVSGITAKVTSAGNTEATLRGAAVNAECVTGWRSARSECVCHRERAEGTIQACDTEREWKTKVRHFFMETFVC